jgi:ubiquitin carboxyl-terminal hydrolase 4/11/15
MPFEPFGLPFYLVLTKEEKNDYNKIYEKIRKRYTQFATADELRHPPPVVEEPPADDAMEDVVLTRQDVNPSQMVTIRVQPWHKPSFLYAGAQVQVEMPTQLDKVEKLYDLRDFLRPPPARMQSAAPSAMESVHQDDLPSPDSIADDPFGNAIEGGLAENAGPLEVLNAQVGAEEPLNSYESDVLMPSDDVDNTLQEPTDINLSDSEGLPAMDHTEREASTPSMHDQSDDSSDLLTPSQLAEEIVGNSRGPTPDLAGLDDILPPYSSFGNPSGDDEIVQHELKFGDQLICEWTEDAYQHVFNNSKYPASWDTYETWINPSPPVETPKQKKNIDLVDCLDEFSKEEQLGEDDLWYCPRCKEHRQARKTLQLWRVPDIFAVHLKRFSSSRTFRDKLENLVEFPLKDFDLTDRVGDKAWIENERGGVKLVYDLFAVDNHYGTLAGGHYTAYAQNFVDGEWYYYDGTPSIIIGLANKIDSSVRSTKPEQAITAAAYLLFYRRRSETPLGGDTSKLIAEHAARIPTVEDSDSSSSGPKIDSPKLDSPQLDSPKLDDATRSASSSSPTEEFTLSKKGPFSGFLEQEDFGDIYAPLKSFRSASLWQGGWSNRTASISSTPLIGFGFGANSNRASGGSSSPVLDSENITPDDAGDADIESANDDAEEIEEVLPMDLAESADEVEIIELDEEHRRPA